MSEWKNVLLRAGDALLYFTVLAGLFRCRHRLGEAALVLGERIRREIAGQADIATARVTVSVGIASAPNDGVLTISCLQPPTRRFMKPRLPAAIA